MSGKKNKDNPTPAFKTFPLASCEKRLSESKSSIPDRDGVKEAKDWVDYNEK